MNIKNRLAKIESKVKINYSPFCACQIYKGKVYPHCEIALEINGVQTVKNPISEFCEKCGKPVEIERIVICFV